MAKIAFLGLGVMGYPMAGHLATAGHTVTVYNRTHSKAKRWNSEFKGSNAESPYKAVTDVDFVMSCVGNDNDLLDITIGEHGAFSNMKKGALFIDHTTVSAQVTEKLHKKSQEFGIGFIDAPISGGQAGAENGVLSIMCGGNESDYKLAEPILEVQGLSEALHFAEKAGLDGSAVIEVISQGAAGSWQMSNRYETMLNDEFEHGFAVDWMRKDLKICLDAGDSNGASLPVTSLVDQFYKDIQKMGGGRWDTSSLFKRLRAIDGLN